MPRIRTDKITKTSDYISLDMESVTHGESNDCVVKAFAFAARIPYSEALRIAKSYGRQPRQGMYRPVWQRMLRDHGVTWETVPIHTIIARYPKAHRILKNVTTHHPDRFHDVWADGERYLLVCADHVLYVENGVNHDWTRGRAKRVVEVLRITSP